MNSKENNESAEIESRVLVEDEFYDISLMPSTSWRLNISSSYHRKQPFLKSLAILTKDYTFKTVGDVVWGWTSMQCPELEQEVILDNENWMYYYSLLYGFRRGIPSEVINISPSPRNRLDYYQAAKLITSYPTMTDEEIHYMLASDPITLRGRSIEDGYHRIAAMIGRLARNERYISLTARLIGIRNQH